jgi:phage/plasmid-associated DNA primase
MDLLRDLQYYLDNTFPGSVLIPSRTGGKIPKYKHKNGQYTAERFLDTGYKECDQGALIILSTDLIVIDIDDATFCQRFEAEFPELAETVCCKTNKGFHFYFTRTQKCTDAGMSDGARQMTEDGAVIPVDIKTQTTSGTGGLISIPPSPNKQWVRKLGEANIYPMPDSFVDFWLAHRSNNKACVKNKASPSPAISPSPSSSPSISSYPQSNDQSNVARLVDMLDKRRADSYEDWMRVGWCLHNIDNGLCPLWDAFSSTSPKYKKGECQHLWGTMRDEGLHMGTLCMWARTDNPSEYAKYQNESVFTLIKNCNGSHNAVADIAHRLYKDKYVCASSSGKLWYCFNGTLWEEDVDAIGLRKELSSGLRNQFLMVMNKLATMDCDERQSSISTTNAANKSVCQQLIITAFKLQEVGFKENIIREMREFFYDKRFLDTLDADPNLLAFTNGVWELKNKAFRPGKPEDRVSLSTGYAYDPATATTHEALMERYFQQLHPDPEQRHYVLRMFARQLYGDTGGELFHIHAGFRGSAGNGKSRYFEVLELALGDYVHKFAVETLVVKQRAEPNKPIPEFKNWKGRRILYCTEPNADDKLNSGVMKELTGGEMISYRMLFSNDIHKFRPMFKLHIMCNDTPQLDGADQGVKRRVRKIDYVARFVDAEEADEEHHMYAKDMGFIERFKHGSDYKMAFLAYVLKHYDHSFEYSMPQVIKDNSASYLDDNNNVLKFVQAHVVPAPSEIFTLKMAKDCFKDSEFFNAKTNLKTGVEKVLKTQCISQKRVGSVVFKNAFYGYKLVVE